MALRRRRFADRRASQGYSQEEFAEALTVAVSTVIRWEGGRATPQPHQRPKIAGLLGVHPLRAGRASRRRTAGRNGRAP
ncbi:multiprotein-bridging factor 1 family protein [Streptomyces sp. NPDC058240]|uniref:helix-turn-helix domain-containing protein n=1 Tax=Streptomyces sp. NPDC058240 TaxID=3346396 RepID=UPI0036F0E205